MSGARSVRRARAPHVPATPLRALFRRVFRARRAAGATPRTMADVALRIGVSESAVRAWAYGRRRCTAAAQLAEALGVDVAEVQAAADATWGMRPPGAPTG